MTGVRRDVIFSLYCVCDNIVRVHLIPAKDHILIVFLFFVVGNACLSENGVETSVMGGRVGGWISLASVVLGFVMLLPSVLGTQELHTGSLRPATNSNATCTNETRSRFPVHTSPWVWQGAGRSQIHKFFVPWPRWCRGANTTRPDLCSCPPCPSGVAGYSATPMQSPHVSAASMSSATGTFPTGARCGAAAQRVAALSL